MSKDSTGASEALERWNDLFNVLSAQSRRMIPFSLLGQRKERRLPLPETAVHSDEPTAPEELSIELDHHHHHLPILAEAGYVRWEREPFRVQRGTHFEEAAVILRWIVQSPEEFPSRLVSDREILGEREDDD